MNPIEPINVASIYSDYNFSEYLTNTSLGHDPCSWLLNQTYAGYLAGFQHAYQYLGKIMILNAFLLGFAIIFPAIESRCKTEEQKVFIRNAYYASLLTAFGVTLLFIIVFPNMTYEIMGEAGTN